jgi:hypothetical protein
MRAARQDRRAGRRRRSAAGGVAPAAIATELRKLLEDTRYWLSHRTYSVDESAARFHHRLVSI